MISQSVYFFYDVLDLAHAAGQPAGAARGFDQQASTFSKSHPRIAARLRH